MSVDPCIADLFLIYLSRRKVSLSDLIIDIVSVDICIVESVVLTDRLGLIIEILDRLIVVDPDISDRFFVVCDRFCRDSVIRAVRCNSDIIYA